MSKGSILTGKLFFNKNEMNSENIQQYISYVIQDSLKNAVMTSREILTSVAELRYAETETHEQIEDRINNMLREMQLEKCADTRFGDDLHKGLSGGEKKRVCIGAKLLIDSPILLLDEPTSGLDSSTSHLIIKFLRDYARRHNKIILTTIHQPSSNIFDLFDKLIILNHGRIIYQGQGGNELSKYFESKGFSMKVNYNPSDSFMKILEELNHGSDEQKFFFNQEYNKEKDIEFSEEINNYLVQTEDNTSQDIDKVEIYSNFVTAFKVNFRDYSKTVARNPQIVQIKILTLLFFTFICGSVFWQLPNTLEGNRGRLGFLLFFTLNNFMQQIINIIMVFPLEKKLLIDDCTSNLYSVAPYTMARQFIDTTINLIIIVIYTALLYFLVGFQVTPTHYFTFLGIYVAYGFCVISIAVLIGCFLDNVGQGFAIMNIGVVTLLIFSSLILNPKNMPVWLAWIRYFNPLFYCIQAALINEFEGVNIQGMNFYVLIKENLEIWHCMVYFIAVGIVLRSMAFVALHLVVKKKI